MKKKRHELILEFIKNNNVSRQEEIIKMLVEHGFNVTQATISRDIKELKIIKEQMIKYNGERAPEWENITFWVDSGTLV